MEDKQFLKGTFKDGSYELDLQSNNIVAKVMYHDVADIVLTIKAKAGLDLLKNLIPGEIDNAIIDAAEAVFSL